MKTIAEPQPRSKITQPVLAEFLKPEVVRAAQNYFAALTLAQAKRAEVDVIQREILTERAFMATLCTTGDTDPDVRARVAKSGRSREPFRITDPKDHYQCQDEELNKWYFAECNRRERAAGIKRPDMPDAWCPALNAENLLIEAEGHLTDVAGAHCGVTAARLHGDKRAKWIDLVLRLVLNHPDTTHHFTSKAILDRFIKKPKSHEPKTTQP